MNRCHSFGLASSRQEKLGRFEEMKEEETADKHEENDGAVDNVEISPSPVLIFRAACFTWCGDVAREEVRITMVFVATKKAPSNCLQ